MASGSKIIGVAFAAGVLGLLASLALNGPGPLLGTEIGQRAVQRVLSATAQKPPAGVGVARRGDRLAAFALPALDGASVRIPTAYAGRPLLLNVWASWCGPCIQEMPELDRFAREQGGNGVQVAGIALDEPAAVEAFLARIPVRYPILLDTPGPADAGVRLGNPKGVLPYTVLVSADGRLLKQRIGPFAAGEIDDWVDSGRQ